MPAVRQLLRHANIETAAGKRKCHRKQNEHKILKGDVCLVIRGVDSTAKNCPESRILLISGRVRFERSGL